MSKILSILRPEERINLAKRLGSGGRGGRKGSYSRKRKQLTQDAEMIKRKEVKSTSRFLAWMSVIQ